MPSKKMQKHAEIIRREMRATPWKEAFAKLAPLPNEEILDLFDCLIFNTPDIRDLREFVVIKPIQHQHGFELQIGLSIATSWDVSLILTPHPSMHSAILYANGTEAVPDDTGLTFSDVLYDLREGLTRNIRDHVRSNLKQAVDTFKLAARCRLYDAFNAVDLSVLVKFLSKSARLKRSTSEKRLVRIKEQKDMLVTAQANASAAVSLQQRKPKKKATTVKGVKWYEATTEQALDAQGFILLEQQDNSWLVTYNNRAPLRAWNEEAARELVSDTIKNPDRLREYVALSGVIKTATVVRLSK